MSELYKSLTKLHGDVTVAYRDILNQAAEDAVRIEALEAALREIADDPTGNCMVCVEIARAALEQDK